MDAKRENRLVILLSDEEQADLVKRAGMVPLSVWVRSMLFEVGLRGIRKEDEKDGDAKVQAKVEELRADVHVLSQEPERTGSREKVAKVGGGKARGVVRRAKSADGGGGKVCSNAVMPGLYCPKCGKRH